MTTFDREKLDVYDDERSAAGRDLLLRIVSMPTRLVRNLGEPGTGTGTGTK